MNSYKLNFEEIKKKTYFVTEGQEVYKCHVCGWYTDSDNLICFKLSLFDGYGYYNVQKYPHELFTDEASALAQAIENTKDSIVELKIHLSELENRLNKIDLEADAC